MNASSVLTALAVRDSDGKVGALAPYSAEHDQINSTSRHLRI
jgi:hypothetical protein